ncbi:hypothetical protein [Pelagicoccus mobilis]|uniref:Uncharacterized protein n=1 Tax=Pelagicoccus mobilis TaxID=415221 RepID=A0A934S7K9_9BACT|nr:hypothetical protein [Pelagicoccus mobilis]MBK1880368.1 hypothetical protein [Pelagicoccus mobilis]
MPLRTGIGPANAKAGVFPSDMEGYMSEKQFEGEIYGNAVWDWQGPYNGIYGLSVSGDRLLQGTMRELDEVLDDGDLSSGDFQRLNGSHYTWIFEEA